MLNIKNIPENDILRNSRLEMKQKVLGCYDRQTLSTGGAVHFDGIDDYISLPQSTLFEFQNYVFTLQAWVRSDDWYNQITETPMFISKGSAYSLGFENGHLVFKIGTTSCIGTSSFIPGIWYYITATWEGEVLMIYVNGILENVVPFRGPVPTTAENLLIGTGLSPDSGYFQGDIDEVRIWNKAFYQSDILADMGRRLTGSETGLIGYWQLDEGTGTLAYDKTSNGNTGSLMNNASWILSDIPVPPGDYQLFFDGNNDYISVPDNPSLNPTEAITLCAWVNSSSWGQSENYTGRILQKGFNDDQYLFCHHNGNLELILSGIGTFTVPIPGENEWHQLAATYSKSNNEAKIFIDGFESASFAVTGNIPISVTSDPLLIGAKSSEIPGSFFNGTMDNISIWSRALSQEEIQNLMFGSINGSESNLVAFWNFNEGTGYTAQDNSPNGNHGKIYNDALWVASNIDFNQKTALLFDGVDDYMITSDNLGMWYVNSPHTVEAWVKVNGLPANSSQILLLGRPNYGNHQWLINSEGTSTIGVWGMDSYQVHPQIPIGDWVHIAVTFNESILKCYLNGNPVSTTNAAFDFGFVPFSLAENYNGESFMGTIDDVRIWNYALSENEIKGKMLSDLSGKEPGLIANWKFNEGIGLTAKDTSPNGNHGILVNGTLWVISDVVLSIEDNDELLPSSLILYQNYPNPFNPSTAVKFSIPQSDNVKLYITNAKGQNVGTLINKKLDRGSYKINFNAGLITAGIYFYTIESDGQKLTRKMLLIK